MKRIDLTSVMSEANMAMITDEYSTYFYNMDKSGLTHGEMEDKVLHAVMTFNLKARKEDAAAEVDRFITLMESLNASFNRTVGAPDSMKTFKVLNKHFKYAGNDTVTVHLDIATLSTGDGPAIINLMDVDFMNFNIFGTKANLMKIDYEDGKETYGLGNAKRSWKRIINMFARCDAPSFGCGITSIINK